LARDGTEDWAPYIQDAIDDAIGLISQAGVRARVTLPTGVLRLDTPLLIQHLTGVAWDYVSLELEGGAGPFGVSQFNGTTLVANFASDPAIVIQSARRVTLRRLAISGQNTWTQSYDMTDMATHYTESNYVVNSCRTNRYSPYAGVCIDPYHSALAGGDRYPGLTAYYVNGGTGGGSSGVVLDDVWISGFVVGVVQTPNGETLNNDGFQAYGLTVESCREAVSTGQSQTRGGTLVGFNFSGCRTALDATTYGDQAGSLPSVWGGMGGNCKYLVNVAYYNHGCTLQGMHIENMLSLGHVGGGQSPGRIAFIGCNFQFKTASNKGAYYRLLNAGFATFDGCLFNNSASTSNEVHWFCTYGNTRPTFINCVFGDYNASRTTPQWHFFAGGYLGGDYVTSWEWNPGTLTSTVFGGVYPHPLGKHFWVDGLTAMQNVAVRPGAAYASGSDTLERKVSSELRYGTVGTSMSVVFSGTGTATIAGVDLDDVCAVGDILLGGTAYYPFPAPFSSILTYGPLGYVTAVTAIQITLGACPFWLSGTVVTDVTRVLTPRVHLATTGQVDFSGDPTQLTSVSQASAWNVGDEIRDVQGRIADGTFVKGISGTTFTLSTAAYGGSGTETLNVFGAKVRSADVGELLPDSLTVPTGGWFVQYKRLQMTGTRRLTLEGTARYCLTDL
jgi:hypothetical protein